MVSKFTFVYLLASALPAIPLLGREIKRKWEIPVIKRATAIFLLATSPAVLYVLFGGRRFFAPLFEVLGRPTKPLGDWTGVASTRLDHLALIGPAFIYLPPFILTICLLRRLRDRRVTYLLATLLFFFAASLVTLVEPIPNQLLAVLPLACALVGALWTFAPAMARLKALSACAAAFLLVGWGIERKVTGAWPAPTGGFPESLMPLLVTYDPDTVLHSTRFLLYVHHYVAGRLDGAPSSRDCLIVSLRPRRGAPCENGLDRSIDDELRRAGFGPDAAGYVPVRDAASWARGERTVIMKMLKQKLASHRLAAVALHRRAPDYPGWQYDRWLETALKDFLSEEKIHFRTRVYPGRAQFVVWYDLDDVDKTTRENK